MGIPVRLGLLMSVIAIHQQEQLCQHVNPSETHFCVSKANICGNFVDFDTVNLSLVNYQILNHHIFAICFLKLNLTQSFC